MMATWGRKAAVYLERRGRIQHILELGPVWLAGELNVDDEGKKRIKNDS